MSNTLCPYLISCEVEDIRSHNCGNYEKCEIYELNELFLEVYGDIALRKAYASIKRFTLEDLE